MKKKFVVISAVLLAAVVIAAAGVIMLNSKPQAPQPSNTITAEDDSMAPAIKQGATVTFDRNINYTKLSIGDIVVFHQAHQVGTFIGRVMNVTDNGIILKGDNKPSPYLGYITQDLYVGRVTQISNP